MVKVYAIDGVIPVVDPSAYVHPSAVLIGDVFVEAGCYIGACAAYAAISAASSSVRARTCRISA